MKKHFSFVEIVRHGDAGVLELRTKELHTPLAGEVLIKQKASAINFIDVYHRTGFYPLPLPHGIGVEASGVVEEVGTGVTQFRPGDRVVYVSKIPKAYAEYSYVQENEIIQVPDTISLIEVAAVFMKGLTVIALFDYIEKITPGSVAYLTAGSGGVGLLACQYARHQGIDLIATASTDEKCQRMLHHGARFAINYKTESVIDRVMEITHGRGVPIVFDSCGEKTFNQSMQLIQPLGTFVSFGSSTGAVPPINIQLLAERGSVKITRASVFNYIALRSRYIQMSNNLFSAISQKEIQPTINQRYKLSEAHIAHSDLESRNNTGSSILEF
ncbi:MAG: quinone oxidoreductase [Methylacidiphilales bacterium]|nr:quinone oxidoreductase [Candidatus Methylacidiphilales bacterium]